MSSESKPIRLVIAILVMVMIAALAYYAYMLAGWHLGDISDRSDAFISTIGAYSTVAQFALAVSGSTVSLDASGSTGNIASYAWDFGDGTTGAGESVNHTYGSPGTYTVNLTVTDTGGNTDSATDTITISSSLTASFSYCGNLAASSPILFDATGSSGNIASYSWDFGDGNTGAGEVASHAYGSPGTYTVNLTVTDTGGNTDSATDTPGVGSPPTWPSLGTASYNGVSTGTATPEGGIFFNPCGTKMYVVERGGPVLQYSLSSPWDLSTASKDQEEGSLKDYKQYGVYIRPDGRRLYQLRHKVITWPVTELQKYVSEYSLSTPWNASTLTHEGKYTISTGGTRNSGIHFNPDGSKLYTITFDGMLRQYSLSTPWDVSTASYDGETQLNVPYDPDPLINDGPQSMFFKPDGTKLYVGTYMAPGNSKIHQFSLSTPWDLSTISKDQEITVQSYMTSGLFFQYDGSRLYESDYLYAEIYQYSLGP